MNRWTLGSTLAPREDKVLWLELDATKIIEIYKDQINRF